MVELVDTLVLEASAQASEFKSRLGHHLAGIIVSQVRRLALEVRGRKFESCIPDHL